MRRIIVGDTAIWIVMESAARSSWVEKSEAELTKAIHSRKNVIAKEKSGKQSAGGPHG